MVLGATPAHNTESKVLQALARARGLISNFSLGRFWLSLFLRQSVKSLA